MSKNNLALFRWCGPLMLCFDSLLEDIIVFLFLALRAKATFLKNLGQAEVGDVIVGIIADGGDCLGWGRRSRWGCRLNRCLRSSPRASGVRRVELLANIKRGP